MTERGTDVIVVGAGLMGAAAAWRLARRGVRVTLLEQFDLGHVRGSSHGASRIFRLAYDIVDYVRLAQSALPLWREAEAELGKDLLWTTGGVDLGMWSNLSPVSAALAQAGVSFERLHRDEVCKRFPAFSIPEGWEAIYQEDAGVLHADTCRLGLVELAGRDGAKVMPSTMATRLAPHDGGVIVETTTGKLEAQVVIVTAAGWSNRLLDPLGLHIPMRVTREHVAYYSYRAASRLVPFIWHEGRAAFEFYGLPNGSPDEAKVAEHGAGPEVDPDSDAVVEQERLESVQHFVGQYLPSLERSPKASETCLYASTPDDDFVLERAGQIILGLGFGGHGFKFGTAVGALLADLAQGRPVALSPRFSLQRFKLAGTVS
jgi:sarcosine oxidase